MDEVRTATSDMLGTLDPHFHDPRLIGLWPLYKARNFPETLTSEERAKWEEIRAQHLVGGGQKSRLAVYFERLQTLMTSQDITKDKRYLLEELRLYGESIMPTYDA
jgi:exodeoxyribonuclease-1